ncbi:MAG: 23S rRNA (uridine(2552)-2'-O)-methyltransferase [Methanobrevibacter sp.]|jgi:23S rRNA (uridine2552-2'-O)-methyltransferase|nr:23S rRNA (uridine(2552)-2'-O)-methyltransferase [Candidatus Methanovirga aequatorialis]
MGSSWQRDKKKEYYYKKAKESSYYSRASYKLLQLNKKYKIIKEGNSVVDLGASPGGWSQVALEYVDSTGLVVGVDLNKIRPINEENFSFIRGDFTTDEIQEEIVNTLNEEADVVISDASPSLSGIKNIDHLRSLDLVESVINLSELILRDRGNILIKFFQGEDFNRVLKELKKKFRAVKTTKPNSSRKKSSEMYLVCLGFKSP